MKKLIKFLMKFTINYILITVIFLSINKFLMNGEGFLVVPRFFSSLFLLLIVTFSGDLAFK